MLAVRRLLDGAGQIAEFLTLLLCIWVSTVIIYRWKFHPAAKYPGPWLAKITDLYGAYQSLRGRSHLATYAAHQRWGPIVRMGPNKLAFDSVTALHQIYYSRHVQKSGGYTRAISAPGPPNTFNCVDKPLHRRKRKVVSQAFSDQALREIEPMILRNVDTFVRELLGDLPKSRWDLKTWSEPVDLSERSTYFTLDVVGAFGFGQSFEMQTKVDNRYISKAVSGAAPIVGIYYQYPGLADFKIERLLRRVGAGGLAWTLQRYSALVKAMVVRRMSMEKDAVRDLYSFIVDGKDPETGMGVSQEEIWAESRLFLVAGSDTTAAALAASFFYLSRNPQCYEKLLHSIRTTFSSGSEIHTGPQLAQCEYLRACIDETLRMSPPVSAALWREVTAPEGLVIDGTWVPCGIDVGASIYAVHHNEDIFPDSFSFAPERWLRENTPPETLERTKKAFNPFSIGARRCVAQPMAYMELTLALAKTLWYVDMRRPEGKLGDKGGGAKGASHGRDRIDEFQLREHFISHHDGPLLEFRCREGLTEELAALKA